MNHFGLGPGGARLPRTSSPLLTLAYPHHWDKGMRVPADIDSNTALSTNQYDLATESKSAAHHIYFLKMNLAETKCWSFIVTVQSRPISALWSVPRTGMHFKKARLPL